MGAQVVILGEEIVGPRMILFGGIGQHFDRARHVIINLDACESELSFGETGPSRLAEVVSRPFRVFDRFCKITINGADKQLRIRITEIRYCAEPIDERNADLGVPMFKQWP